jgi:hypothetical protein
MEDLVDFQIEERIKLPFKFIHALNAIFLYGTAIALVPWKKQEKKIKKVNPVIDETGIQIDEQIVEETITVYDDPDTEFIPIDDFFPDPEGWDIESSSFVCTRVFKDEKYLRDMEKQGIYKLPEKIEESGVTTTDFRNDINNSSEQGDKKKNHELISYYTDDVQIVVLNRSHIIRKVENDRYDKEKPFKRVVAIPLEKEFWGMSVVDVLADLQEELNTTRNQRIDNVSLILNKIFLKRRNADIDPAEVKSKSGHVIETDDIHNDIKTLDTPDVTASAYQEEQIIKNDMQYISGVSEFSRGATPQRKETATTVTTIQEAANVLFNYTIGVIERTGLLALADDYKKLNQQYMTQDKIIRLYDNASNSYNYPVISPERIAGNYDVTSVSPRLEAQANKENKRQQLLEMLDRFTKNPATAQYINVPELLKKIMENYDIKDYSKLIIEPSPIPPAAPQDNPEIMPMNPEMMQGMMPGGGMIG